MYLGSLGNIIFKLKKEHKVIDILSAWSNLV